MTPAFLDRLHVVKDNGTWTLTHEVRYDSAVLECRLTVPAGFTTDFASVPRLPFAYWLTGNTAHRPAVVHDFLYQRHLVDRATADAIFAEAMAVEGEPAWRRGLMWSGVRTWGWLAWRKRSARVADLNPRLSAGGWEGV